jgi:Domain of unknown function (DUF4281)
MMAVDTWFAWANQLAVPGWLCLIVGLMAGGFEGRHAWAARLARASLFVGGRLLPTLLALGYAAALWQWFGTAEGGFDSLRGVERLFETRGMVLAGWLHFLAFDLWLGRWQVDRLTAVLHGSPGRWRGWAWRAAVVPCLLGTFLVGPVGLLMFLALLVLHGAWRQPADR